MVLQKKVKKRNPTNWDDPVDKEEPTQEDVERFSVNLKQKMMMIIGRRMRYDME